jgi:hypothetical protein
MTKALVLVCLLLLAGSARAANQYLCSVNYVPKATTLGNEGYLYVSIYSAPACGGSYLGYGYLCSTGSTQTACALQLNASQILTVFQALQYAVKEGQSVYFAPIAGYITQLVFLGN